MDPLPRRLRDRILAEGPVPFATFMEEALYDPDHGYYSRGSPVGGEGGDFYTAAELPGFARMLARQAADVHARLDRPDPWSLVELGAGDGSLAVDLLDALADEDPAASDAVRFAAVERSPANRDALEARGFDVHARLGDVPGPRRGVVLGNEVLDAQPVHVLRQVDGRLRERCVTWDPDGEGFVWTTGPPARPDLARVLEEDGTTLRDGQEVAVSPAALELVEDVAGWLEAGAGVLLDYGDLARELHRPGRGSTVRAFRGHELVDDVLAAPGSRDLTASVDFTACRRAAQAAGADARVVPQGRFLLALGILDVHGELGAVGGAGVKTLVLPGGMGERFKVLAFARGVDLDALRGLGDPFGTPPWLDG